MRANNCNFVGRITRDPELSKTKNDKSKSVISIAVYRIGAQDGQQQADFIRCISYNKKAEFIAQYVKKGALVYCAGEFRIDEYEKDGERKSFPYLLLNEFNLLEKKQAQVEAQVEAHVDTKGVPF